MAIRITRNEEGNCITFVGSSNPAYWNACLSAELNENDPNRVDIINDIRTANEETVQYEFYAVEYQDFADRDNNVFTSAQEMVDYVNANANVIGISSTGKDLTGIDVNFRLDDTHTSIIMDNGFAFGVNTIKAVAATDGTIHINAIGTGTPSNGTADDKEHFTHMEHTRVSINDVAVPGGINDVVNALNELFTVGAFEAVVISDPYSTMVADVAGEDAGYTLVGTTAVDPTGTDIFTNSSSGSLAGLLTTATIDQAGEYYTFDIRGEGQIGFGLVHTQDSYDNGYYSGSATYANPTTFATSNNAHYGFQFSHWFHPTPNGSWTNYGANTSYVMGPGWYSANTQFEGRDEWLAGTPIKVRVGINENGFIHIDSLKDDGVTWVTHARTGYPVPEGSEYKLGIKCANASPRVATAPKVHLLEEEAPVMNFRYTESPDGVYNYPLFATEEEANYYDKVTQGTETGASHPHVYADDPTGTTWYMPDHNNNMGSSIEPAFESFNGQMVTYTEITTLTNADLTPPAFTAADLTVDELSTVNYQTQPADTGYTTSISGLPAGLSALSDGSIHGTAPEVTGDNAANPSDSYTITVTRTNAYGSSTGTFDIIVTNLTAPEVHAITGFHHESASTSMVDSDTLDDGSVVRLQNAIDDGNRFVMDKAWIDTYVLPAITPGSGQKSVWIGFPRESGALPAWSNGAQSADFEVAFQFYSDDTNRANNNWRLRTHVQGTQINDIGIGSQTSGLYNYLFINDGGEVKIGGLLPSYGDATSFVWDAGSVSWEQVVGSLATQTRDIYIGTDNCQLDIATANLHEVAEPTAPTSLTNWSKAVAFDGSNERALQVDSGSSRVPMKMAGINNNVAAPSSAGNTSNDANSRPWATAIVFNINTYNDNQHIWNVGEGSGSTDDNIYLRRSTDRKLYFGWGRQGEVNEMLIHPDGTGEGWSMTPGNWYGIYIAHTGERLGSGHTAAEIADCFDIRLMGSSANWDTAGYSDTNLSTAANWTAGSFGARMNRQLTGDMTIGGRGANRSFRGKVASFVSTTLRRGVLMPSDAEIAMMITDPMQWAQDYKVGEYYRAPNESSDRTDWQFTNSVGGTYPSWATQIWLMGDGPNDSYSNMIRNQANPGDQNYTKLNLISMVSNDIQNVTIPGLS